MSRVGILRELWQFFATRKKAWMIPMVAVLVGLGLLLALTAGSAVAPFIYALF